MREKKAICVLFVFVPKTARYDARFDLAEVSNFANSYIDITLLDDEFRPSAISVVFIMFGRNRLGIGLGSIHVLCDDRETREIHFQIMET